MSNDRRQQTSLRRSAGKRASSSQGQTVPQVRSLKQENLFPRFTTVRHPIDGKHWFPVYTHADDTLDFRTGPQRIRLTIRYSNYKRFGSESSVTFGKQ